MAGNGKNFSESLIYLIVLLVSMIASVVIAQVMQNPLVIAVVIAVIIFSAVGVMEFFYRDKDNKSGKDNGGH